MKQLILLLTFLPAFTSAQVTSTLHMAHEMVNGMKIQGFLLYDYTEIDRGDEYLIWDKEVIHLNADNEYIFIMVMPKPKPQGPSFYLKSVSPKFGCSSSGMGYQDRDALYSFDSKANTSAEKYNYGVQFITLKMDECNAGDYELSMNVIASQVYLLKFKKMSSDWTMVDKVVELPPLPNELQSNTANDVPIKFKDYTYQNLAELLGESDDLLLKASFTGGVSNPTKNGKEYTYQNKGVKIAYSNENGIYRGVSVTLFSGFPGMGNYQHPIPYNLKWGMSMDQVKQSLPGQPQLLESELHHILSYKDDLGILPIIDKKSNKLVGIHLLATHKWDFIAN